MIDGEYKAAWNEEVTDCCGISPQHGGGYPEYYKKWPKVRRRESVLAGKDPLCLPP